MSDLSQDIYFQRWSFSALWAQMTNVVRVVDIDGIVDQLSFYNASK
jgi:hypothetical protein